MKNIQRVRRAADLVWAASLELEPALHADQRVEVTTLALERLLPEDAPRTLAASAIGAVAFSEEGKP